MQNFLLQLQENKNAVIGIVGGVFFLAIAGVVFLYIGNPFASQTAVTPKNTSHTPPQIADFKETNTASGTLRYLLPKSKVNEVYSSIYNNMANETLVLMRAYQNDMFPLLIQSQAAAKNKDYTTLQSIGNRVKIINDAQKVRLATLSGDLDSLATANKVLADLETVRLTNDMITSGKDMVAKYTAMANLVDSMITGSVSASTATDMKTVSSSLELATKAFFTAAQKLGAYFTNTLKSDVKTYLATHPATSTPN